jgi:hypothetical protein
VGGTFIYDMMWYSFDERTWSVSKQCSLVRKEKRYVSFNSC